VVINRVGGSGAIAAGATTRYQAQLFDQDGRLIDGVAWNWQVISNWDGVQGGMGMLVQVPNYGLEAQMYLMNRIYRGDIIEAAPG